jgi:N-methylhydantoinase A
VSMKRDGHYRVGVDIGGTFTDVVLMDEATGALAVSKSLTTEHDPAVGVVQALVSLLADRKVEMDEIQTAIHGTTLVTNAIIQRKGARVGLITSQGFRDVLEIGREMRYDLYDLFITMPAPLVPRARRFEVPERTDKNGAPITPLDIESLVEVIGELKRSGCDAIAIVFLHSYANDTSEQDAARIVREHLPDVAVCTSSDVAREIREFERTSTTVANAYVMPLAERYLEALETKLAGAGFGGSLHVMLSNGGIASPTVARQTPIRLVESGPAAGALGAGYFAEVAGLDRVLAFDMGGTTAKACIVDGGEPLTTYDLEVGRMQRFRRGSGLPLKIAAVDIMEIGAGGGSIARFDSLGLLKVGPESAGPDPGPACYGKGGREATVTDADLVLGFLNPEFFLGGDLHLNLGAARDVCGALATAAGLDRTLMAWGVHDLVNENMASAARVHFAEIGRDPSQYTLVATGGAGPVHAYRIAQKLEMGRILCPLGAGVASTVGLLVAPPQFDLVQADVVRLDALDLGHLSTIYSRMEESARQVLTDAGVATEEISLRMSADARYVGQGYEVVTPIKTTLSSPDFVAALRKSFEDAYRLIFERTLPDAAVEILNWRLTATGSASARDSLTAALRTRPSGSTSAASSKGSRQAYMPEVGEYVTTPVYDRYSLRPFEKLRGPAIVEERESTAVIGFGAPFWTDDFQNLMVEVANGSS